MPKDLIYVDLTSELECIKFIQASLLDLPFLYPLSPSSSADVICGSPLTALSPPLHGEQRHVRVRWRGATQHSCVPVIATITLTPLLGVFGRSYWQSILSWIKNVLGKTKYQQITCTFSCNKAYILILCGQLAWALMNVLSPISALTIILLRLLSQNVVDPRDSSLIPR